MSYTTEDKSEHISELQEYLRSIAFFEQKIPMIVPVGIFNHETSDAVKAFQDSYGLPATGNVDYETWNKIVTEYEIIKNKLMQPAAIMPFRSVNFRIQESDSGSEIYIIQVMLNKIADDYSNLINVEINGSYNKQTADAIKNFQKLCGIEENGIIDITTWNLLAKAFNAE